MWWKKGKRRYHLVSTNGRDRISTSEAQQRLAEAEPAPEDIDEVPVLELSAPLTPPFQVLPGQVRVERAGDQFIIKRVPDASS